MQWDYITTEGINNIIRTPHRRDGKRSTSQTTAADE
jgi:hypothetical protein